MDIFDGLHPQCADSIDMEKSDTSEDSDMEVIGGDQPASSKAPIHHHSLFPQVTDAQKNLQCSPLLSCLCPRWFLFLGWFLVWGMFLFLGRGFTLRGAAEATWMCL